MSQSENYRSFYVYKFDTVEKILYTATAIHIGVEKFTKDFRAPPTKEKIQELNKDPTALKYVPERENPDWIAYAFLPNDYHKCTLLSFWGHKVKSFLMIIQSILSAG